MYQQLILGKPWGERPMSDTALVIVSILFIGLILLVMGVLWFMKLVIEITDSGIRITLKGIKQHLIKYEAIKEITVEEHSNTWSFFRGAGYKFGYKTRYYNLLMSNVYIKIKTKKKIKYYIGSTNPERLLQHVNSNIYKTSHISY